MKQISFSLLVAFFTILAPAAVAPVPPVILTEQGIKNLGLETVMVEESDFETTTFALGRLEPIPEKCSILSSRVAGRVLENRMKVGSFVTKGEKLLLLESRQPGDPPPSIWLTAPADGTTLAVNARLGSPVEPSDTLAEFADLQTMYLVATLPQATAGKIKPGARANVHFPIRPEKSFTATLLKLADCSDFACMLGQDVSQRSTETENPNINTTSIIFTIDNPDGQLRKDMNAECSIIMEKRTNVLSVPRAALQGSPANRHVYVKHPSIPHAFDRVNVQTGITSRERIEVIDGLFPGDEVVTRGAYSLGFAGSSGGPSLKEAMDAAHGHDHNEDGSELTPGQQPAGGDDHGHDHAHEDSAISTRETFFMITTGILAILLVVISLRRRPSDDATLTDLT